ncbi:FkbM family methyltransferase [Kribbella speibonae]|uniref:FkbM family methyltransferase n=1 Tax=Kribbella speibonae TaxID=1572660 RepID=UPI0013F40701|nr:FkbM family methyltransferase [Kribbella speibonae]
MSEAHHHLAERRFIKMFQRTAATPAHLRTGPDEVVARLFTGQKIYVATQDISVAPHLILDGIWEPPITRAWLSVTGSASTVFDIGANFGYYGLIAAARPGRTPPTIRLFEPNAGLLPYLRRTLSVNWLNEIIRIENVAVSDRIGTARLHILKDYVGCSSLHTIEHLNSYLEEQMEVVLDRETTVDTTTVDAYCDAEGIEQVDLIKLDVEGFEEAAYDGMTSTVRRSPRLVLFVEFTWQSYRQPEQLFDRMLHDFGHIATIDEAGRFVQHRLPRYHDVISQHDDWTMVVFSKQPLTKVRRAAARPWS